jgi:hypothetical protein
MIGEPRNYDGCGGTSSSDDTREMRSLVRELKAVVIRAGDPMRSDVNVDRFERVGP